MGRPTLYEAAGGAPAMLALATDFHARCLADPVLEHPFSKRGSPEHVQRLADYWGEVLGGPPVYSEEYGGHEAVLRLHANQVDDEDPFSALFLDCFNAAVAATLPADPELRAALDAYMRAATAEVASYFPMDAKVPAGAPMPHWDWDGPVQR
ncbi:group II truncated hemoglobin [Actinoplanes aureus]|uniref:Group II truncated hemoglobin n=1 Tax=Actinoplanes aureus TaxID=2792083 RepID=A0A931C6N5_9ACTN|nr:group II truncated hemoglobin [Actinoplanes aureus]MBG0562367.1 group II truncated hemoglobin [Actinoplanes aureus]